MIILLIEQIKVTHQDVEALFDKAQCSSCLLYRQKWGAKDFNKPLMQCLVHHPAMKVCGRQGIKGH